MRYFITNISGVDINEFKPGIGAFTFLAGKSVEITDFREPIIDFRGKEIVEKGEVLTRLKHSAQEIAEAIVRDRKLNDLRLDIKEDLVVEPIVEAVTEPVVTEPVVAVEPEVDRTALEARIAALRNRNNPTPDDQVGDKPVGE